MESPEILLSLPQPGKIHNETQKSVSQIPESRHDVSIVADRLDSERPGKVLGTVDPWSAGGVLSKSIYCSLVDCVIGGVGERTGLF